MTTSLNDNTLDKSRYSSPAYHPVDNQNQETINRSSSQVIDGTVNYENTDTLSINPPIFKPLDFSHDDRNAYITTTSNPKLPHPDLSNQNNLSAATGAKTDEQAPPSSDLSSQKNAPAPIRIRVSEQAIESSDLSNQNKIPSSIKTKIAEQAPDPSTPPTTPPNTNESDPDQGNVPIIPEPLNKEQKAGVQNFYNNHAITAATRSFIENANPPLSDKEVLDLNVFLTTQEVSDDIVDYVKQIKLAATEQTRIQFNLPVSWTVDTTDPAAWTPITTTNVDEILAKTPFISTLLTNIDQVLNDILTAGQKVLNAAGDDQSRLALADFLKVIGEAIQNLKKTLQEIQIADANKLKDTTKQKFSEIQDRADRQAELQAKQKEALEKQEKANKVNKTLKIVGPIVSVLATVGGIALTALTFGIAAPAAIAIITVAIAFTAYSIADSVSNVTQQAVEAFNKSIENLLPVPPHTETERKVVKFVIVAVIAAALIAVIAGIVVSGAGAGAAASVGTQVTSQVIQKAVAEAAKQIAIQLLLLTVLGSNAVPELVSTILKEHNVSGEAQKAAEIIVTIITILALLLAVAKGSKVDTSAAVKGASTSFSEGLKVGIREAVASLKKIIEQGAKQSIEALGKQVLEALKKFGEAIIEYIKQLRNIPSDTIGTIKGVINAFKDKDIVKFLRFIVPIAKASPLVADAIGGAIIGKTLLDVRKILLDQGEIQAAEELLNALIDLLEKLAASIQGGLGNLGDELNKLNDFFNKIYKTGGQALDGLYRDIPG
jgi:invasin B